MKLPTRDKIGCKKSRDVNPLEEFIYSYQPTNNTMAWRDALNEAVEFLLEQKTEELNVQICRCGFDKDGWRDNLPYEMQRVGDRYTGVSFRDNWKIVTESDEKPCSFYNYLIQQTRRHKSDCQSIEKKAEECICGFNKKGERKLSIYPYSTSEHRSDCPSAPKIYAKKAPKKVIPKLDLSRHINVLDEYGTGGAFGCRALKDALREIQDAYNKSL